MSNTYKNLIDSGLLANQEKDGDGARPAALAMESAASIFARRRAQVQAWRPMPQEHGNAAQQPAGIDVAAIFAARRSQVEKPEVAE